MEDEMRAEAAAAETQAVKLWWSALFAIAWRRPGRAAASVASLYTYFRLPFPFLIFFVRAAFLGFAPFLLSLSLTLIEFLQPAELLGIHFEVALTAGPSLSLSLSLSPSYFLYVRPSLFLFGVIKKGILNSQDMESRRFKQYDV